MWGKINFSRNSTVGVLLILRLEECKNIFIRKILPSKVHGSVDLSYTSIYNVHLQHSLQYINILLKLKLHIVKSKTALNIHTHIVV